MSFLGNDTDWHILLKEEIEKPYFGYIKKQISAIKKSNIKLCPGASEVFKQFKHVNCKDTKLVIMGMEPYANSDYATGTAFEIPFPYRGKPPSFTIISEYLNSYYKRGDLYVHYDKKYTMLLNRYLTTIEGVIGAHTGIGWDKFTDEVIRLINKNEKVAFILMGNHAQQVGKLIDSKHCVINIEHPAAAARNKREWNHGDFIPKVIEYFNDDSIFDEIILPF
jgi:uracil-DNA glycosylase